MDNVNITRLIELHDNLRTILNSKDSWEGKHHHIFYVDMTVADLREADEGLMKDYVPVVSSNRSECLHLLHHIEKKVAYLKELV